MELYRQSNTRTGPIVCGRALRQLVLEHRIDGELLRYAARFGLLAHKDDQIDENDRYAIRAGFWREFDTHPSGTAD